MSEMISGLSTPRFSVNVVAGWPGFQVPPAPGKVEMEALQRKLGRVQIGRPTKMPSLLALGSPMFGFMRTTSSAFAMLFGRPVKR